MVKSLLSLISLRQNSILSGAAILMFAVFASKVLGLIRDRLLVHNFDTSTAAIFLAAFSLPDLIFQLLIFGALSLAFIPVFTDFISHKGEEEAFKFATTTLNLALLIFTFASVLAFVFVAPLNSLLVPGFSGEQKQLTDSISRIILLAEIALLIGSFFIALAQSYQRFIIPSLAPLFYNLGIIFGIVFLSKPLGIMGPAFGVVIGAILHALIQLPLISSLGFKYELTLDLFNSGVREIIRMMSLRNLGLVFEQISDRVAIALSSLISYQSVTLLTFAQHLYTVPIGLFGATIAQAALPVLSREHSKGEIESFKLTLLTTMHQILFLTLPAAAILIVLRIPAVRLVFGASQFDWDDTVLTGMTVAWFAVGLAAQSVILLLVRGFYAFKDIRTPVLVSFIGVLINIVLNLLVVYFFNLDVWGLALSSAVATNISVLLLIYYLHQKVGGFDRQALFAPASKMLLAAIVSAIALYIPIKALDQLVFDTTKTINLLILTGIASIFGLGIYLILVWLLKVEELATFVNLIKKISKFQTKLKTEELVDETSAV
ncbi:murein biosynthesis integral membrane protein MurJ [Candidatus Daviesbacteria bacterium]|nr:murein biosynthesis integral membrane protein MurJ [Candidatus Daviesbacteria bacterium]